ncbi:ABC transporter substrate-binding protein [Saccharibacter sp. EH611]|nr:MULTISPECIES: penicillin-binding protein activator [unclassified Saccharibacter]MXV35362.1 ABC transporter substrate-binding protein [Saccharibacter sp. EH611]MXV57790.1 ABC transporter substrate-binding protein [Saccharibacter sp. EH70]MXV65296.1 ABC transporter substrate-binding protein [Saccharibacter sp. EH60]
MAGVLMTLNACSGEHERPFSQSPVSMNSQNQASTGEQRIGLILPLTGPRAGIGLRMREAARLALPEGQKPELDIFDSAQPGGALKAAQAALAAKDRVVTGPLTAGETAQVADIVQPAHVPELAFTSDVQQARPGVWAMGLTPEQQVHRLVDASIADGRKHFAAFLPDTALGHAMGEGLAAACQEANLEPPKIVFHTDQPEDIATKMADLSAISARRAPQQTSASSNGDDNQPSAINPVPDSTSDATVPPTPHGGVIAPPPFDALLLGDTGLNLARVITSLKNDQIDSLSAVRILGPMLWRSFDGKLGDLRGAWYVAFDPKQRSGYVQRYQAVYRHAPSPVTDFAYDSVALAAALTRQNALNTASLTRPDGFMGVNGVFRLKTDGRVLRDLGIYQILPGGGGQLVIPASQHFQVSAPAQTLPAPTQGKMTPKMTDGLTQTSFTP